MRSAKRRDLVRAEALAEVARPGPAKKVRVLESKAGEHHFGSYLIRLERQGAGFDYDVSTAAGARVVAGFDLLSATEEMALDGITARLSGRGGQ